MKSNQWIKNIKNSRYINRYSVVFAFFMLIIILFDESSLWNRYQLRQEIKSVEKEIMFYSDEIEQDLPKLEFLEGSKEELESFAREKYLMKKKNEVIYIIEE